MQSLRSFKMDWEKKSLLLSKIAFEIVDRLKLLFSSLKLYFDYSII